MRIPLHLRLISSFLRLFFQLLYHQFSWTYDWVAATVSLGMWSQWVRVSLPYLTGPRVLELGHGPGHLQLALKKLGLQSAGLDRSPQMGRQAFTRLSKSGFTPMLVNGYAQFLPFPSCSFNQVVATFPTEFISHPHTLAEVYRVLAPGGSLVVLPLAWITGTRFRDRLAAALFRVTGQAPAWNDRFTAPIRDMGFEVKVETVDLDYSRVLLVLATKPFQAASTGII